MKGNIFIINKFSHNIKCKSAILIPIKRYADEITITGLVALSNVWRVLINNLKLARYNNEPEFH